jgi:GNAT superfamily N-acetyltransferase
MARILRRAVPADTAIIVEFNEALARESEGKILDRAVLTTGVAAVFTDDRKGFYTVVEDDGVIVGQCQVTYEWSDWRNGWYWWIQSVYVREAARRSGVFTALYQHLETVATQSEDVIGIRLYVERDNSRAAATYAKLGMVEEPYNLMARYPLPGKENAVQKSKVGS